MDKFIRNFVYGFKSFKLVVEEYWADPESKDSMATLYAHDQYGFELAVFESKTIMQELLARSITSLNKEKNGAYSERNQLVALLSKIFPASIEKHDGKDWEDDWRNVVFIDLPSGQCSWHIHDSELPLFKHLKSEGRKWDGHSNELKYMRVKNYEKDVFR